MQPYLRTCRQCVLEVRSGLPSCIVTLSSKNLMQAWCDATIDFTIYNDVDTTGLPFVFIAGLGEEVTRIVEPYNVYVVCMEYFQWDKPDIRGVCFGAISAVGRTDAFSPIQIVEIAREAQEHARKTLAEVKKIW